VPSIARVEVNGVFRTFGGRPVLRGVTARFEAGEIALIEGANGAGKSTLLNILGTRLRPTSGTVTYVGVPQIARDIREELGWLAHDLRAYPDLTARENVELGARLHGVDEREAWERTASQLGLADFAAQVVRTLSRGQRQRVALAKAIAHSPSLLLLDEPVTGLDAESVERVERLLIDERARGTTIVVVNHTAGFADRVGGRRLRLERGRVVAA
jgi:heme exporter protein A